MGSPRAEHNQIVESHAAFGVPTICIDDCELGVFGPVISAVPETTEEAVEMWRHVSWLTRNPNFAEMKRDRRPSTSPNTPQPNSKRRHPRRADCPGSFSVTEAQCPTEEAAASVRMSLASS